MIHFEIHNELLMEQDVFFTSQLSTIINRFMWWECACPFRLVLHLLSNQQSISQFPFGGGSRPARLLLCFAWRLHVKRLTLDGWDVWKVMSFAIHRPLELSPCVQSFSCAPFSCWRYTARACSVWLKPTLTDTFHRASIHRPLDRPSNRPLDRPSHQNNTWRIT